MLSYIVLAQHKALLQKGVDVLLHESGVIQGHIYTFAQQTPQPPIEEIRRIKIMASSQFEQPTAFVVWNIDGASELTQNTLLKIVEEHPDNLLFIFPVTSEVSVLPTIVSRLAIKRMAPSYEELADSTYAQVWQKILENPHSGLASTLIGVDNKKTEDIVPVIHDFLHYGYQYINKQQTASPMIPYLTKALYALRLITEQNMDPELALNSIFL
ncbi:MAG: hypothetical protein NUV52_01080 [Candidatus Roizmanbacteria bacterium]|nr:hypothetical protein [Candidatus Roizmanbacteria bacterium]